MSLSLITSKGYVKINEVKAASEPADNLFKNYLNLFEILFTDELFLDNYLYFPKNVNLSATLGTILPKLTAFPLQSEKKPYSLGIRFKASKKPIQILIIYFTLIFFFFRHS